MKLFNLIDSAVGSISAVELTGGVRLSNVLEVEQYFRSLDSDQYYGDGVHRLAVALESVGVKFRTLSKLRTGEICSIKLGKVKISDIGRWKMNLKVDRDESLLEGVAVEDRVPSSPTLLVINDYKAAIAGEGFRHAQDSKISLMEAILSSARIPSKGFKPAYRGGLIVSPADPNKVYENVVSYDIASSYPWAAAATAMPYGESKSISAKQLEGMKVVDGQLPLAPGLGFIGKFKVTGLKRRSWVRIPSLKASDEDYAVNGRSDRLGLLTAEEITLAMCPQDLRLLSMHYSWENIEVQILEVHRLKKLPKSIIAFLGNSFKHKEEAQGAERLRAKVAINSVIGLWGTDPFKSALKEELVSGGLFRQRYSRDLVTPWAKYAGIDGPGFSSSGRRPWDFRWAVYACAAARLRVAEAELALYSSGLEVLYCDTDSIKMVGDKAKADAVFEKLNSRVSDINKKLKLPLTMGGWVDESAGYCKAYFRGKKFYAIENAAGERKAYVAGIYKADADKMIQAVTLEELCDMNTIRITSSRPDFAKVKNDTFGAAYQEIPRAVEYTYNRTEMTIEVL